MMRQHAANGAGQGRWCPTIALASQVMGGRYDGKWALYAPPKANQKPGTPTCWSALQTGHRKAEDVGMTFSRIIATKTSIPHIGVVLGHYLGYCHRAFERHASEVQERVIEGWPDAEGRQMHWYLAQLDGDLVPEASDEIQYVDQADIRNANVRFTSKGKRRMYTLALDALPFTGHMVRPQFAAASAAA